MTTIWIQSNLPQCIYYLHEKYDMILKQKFSNFFFNFLIDEITLHVHKNTIINQ